MARLTIGQKANRVLKLLMGMDNPAVIEALKPYGFTKDDLEDGWNRLRGLTRRRLDAATSGAAATAIAEVDAFENQWFPVARLTLSRHHPAAADYLFTNLPQTTGMHVILSVQVFLERLTELGSGATPLGEEGVAARNLLGQRGLTPQVAAEIQAVLDRARAYNDQGVAMPNHGAEAEAALWVWYREWGGIVRLSISDRRTLRSLGFLKSTRSTSVDGDVEAGELEEIEEETPAAPVAAPEPPVVTTQAPAAPAPVESTGLTLVRNQPETQVA